MEKILINTDALNTVSDCLEQLSNAEIAQNSIELQLMNSSQGKEWRMRATFALAAVKGKRRIITARLAVLRHQEKLSNHAINNKLINHLKTMVPESVFNECLEKATAVVIGK
ncbi:hypothetical protein ACEF96_004411 [Salmonella enterica]|nr:hypothetical protein [Salmonella enterica]